MEHSTKHHASSSLWRATLALGLSAFLSMPTPVWADSFVNPNQPSAVAQAKNVKGHIVDENGEPMIGVTIKVVGSKTNGAISDLNGNFSIAVPSGKNIVLSYTGYKNKTIKVSGASLDITMEPDVLGLEDVVVIGYGTMKKRDLTGAVSTVSSDVVKLTPSSNPMEALQGRVAGLDITKSSSQAGAGVDMQLRGNRSITESGNPLFLIDGMPGDYSSLNPNDIESIEVLKDASSTAVYGSSGSNGVVIITTKKGQLGKTNINFNSYVGINGWSTLPKMSGEHYYNTAMEAKKWAGTFTNDDEVLSDEFKEAFANRQFIDWPDAMLKTGFIQNYSLSLSSGTQKSQTYVSLNYSDEKGQYEGDRNKIYSSSIRLNYNLLKWLSAGVHSQLTWTKRKSAYSKLDQAMRANPFGSLYKEDGSINEYPVIGDNRQVNLLLNTNEDAYKNWKNSLNMYIQPYIRITPLKGLSLESRLSLHLSYSNTNNYIGYNSYQFYDAAGTGALNADKASLAQYTNATISNSHSTSYQWENIVTYDFDLWQDHHFTLTGVATYSDNESESSSEKVDGITSNAYYWTNLGAATGSNKTLSSGYSMGKSLGFIGRVSYSYLGRYLASVSVRHDGNSKLSKDVRWDTFPAFSLGWRISEEKFMEPTRGWLDNLKIRFGWGITGAAGISAYSSWSTLQQGKMSLGGETINKYYFPETITNPLLTWEKSKNTNIGIDAAFLGGRIDLSADYYVTNTDDVIWKLTLPVNNGAMSASNYFRTTANIAETKNKGFELTLNTRNIVKKDFTWTSTITFSNNHEEITSLGEGAGEYIQKNETKSTPNYAYHVGSAINSFYDYKCVGVWQNDEADVAACYGLQPGDLKIDIPNMVVMQDENGNTFIRKYYNEYDENGNQKYNDYTADNTYTPNDMDMQIIGHNSPSWSLGFQNTFTYKNFDLSIYMYTRQGQTIYYEPLTWYSSSGGQFPDYFNYWTPENPSNDFPSLNASRNWKNVAQTYYTSRAYVDGSFFKIKNITLGYTLPQKVAKRLGISNFRAYATITNPYVWAKSKLIEDYDPEQNGSLDFPLTRQLVFGINLSF